MSRVIYYSILRWLVFLIFVLVIQANATAQIEFPEGEGKKIVMYECSGCHSLVYLTDPKRTAAQWEYIVNSMISLGASLHESDVDIVVKYLSNSFGKESATDHSK